MVLVLISEPNALKNVFNKNIEVVGPSYWGNYAGVDYQEEKGLKCIEVKRSKTREKVVAGSKSYMGKANGAK